MPSATISALCVLLLLICSPGPVAGQSNSPSTSSPPSQVLPAPTKVPESQGVTEAKSVPLGTDAVALIIHDFAGDKRKGALIDC